MKVVVNPKYAGLTDFLKTVTERNYSQGTLYRNARNRVEETTVDGHHVVVKIFGKPSLFNRLVYTVFRPTKARRSYEYSLKLLDMGFEVPEPVGYVESYKTGLIHLSCFVCLYSDYRPVADFISYGERSEKELPACGDFVREFSKFTAALHGSGVIHGEFNRENILYKRESDAAGDEKWHFAMIDLNRASFGNKNQRKFALEMGHLGFDITLLAAVVKCYSAIRGVEPRQTLAYAVEQSCRYSRRKRIKKSILGALSSKRTLSLLAVLAAGIFGFFLSPLREGSRDANMLVNLLMLTSLSLCVWCCVKVRKILLPLVCATVAAAAFALF